MKTQGFLQSLYDPCVYMKKLNDEIFNLIILMIYAMTCLFWLNSDVDECKSKLKFAFKIKDMVQSKSILDMNFE